MLILCIGPDTFRAQAKARDLEQAFREKFDPSGSSTERVSSGKDGVDEVMEKAGTASLFSPRRFLRGTDLLADCPKAKLVSLGKVLAHESENIIVVSIETDPPPETLLKALGPEVKIIKYEFKEERGSAFQKNVQDMAKLLGVSDETVIKQIAVATDGDSWLAWNELVKASALGSSSVRGAVAEPSIYDYVDSYLRDEKQRYSFAKDEDMASQILAILVSQSRSAIRARDGATEGIHPFVVKKMRAHVEKKLGRDFAHALSALMAQRIGLGNEEELSLIL